MYSEAQYKIDDPNDHGELAKSLRTLNALGKILHKQRQENGALMLASSEIRFNLEGQEKDPIDVELKQMYDTNSMVEVCSNTFVNHVYSIIAIPE